MILVVAATARELAHGDGWEGLCCGVGPIEAAAATAHAIAMRRPLAVLHVGIAGARRARGLAPASLVIGAESLYCDSNVPATWAPSRVSAPAALLAAVQHALPSAPALVIGTSARVGGTVDCDVEAMEGFGVLRAAQLAGVPAIEVRAISNDIEEADRTRWHFDDAFRAITQVTPRLVAAITASLVEASASHA
jgi:nucleoside phosphorylase